LTTLSSWGPTLVITLALLIAGMIALRVAGTRPRETYIIPRVDQKGYDALRIALDFAETINAYNVSSFSDPSIHLEEIVRLTPTKYQEGALEIPRQFKEGRVVSVDLSLLSIANAARTVDFCSGLLSGTSGWLFRATDRVIVLTPTRR
jgi:FtsZ-interacting cell division protein YlmF